MNFRRSAVSDYDLAIGRTPDVPYLYRARAKAKRELEDADGAQAESAQRDQETAERLEQQ